MAALALGFVGTAIGGSIGGTILGISASAIGGFIGAQIGGLIDNMLFAGSQRSEGPRRDDLSVISSAYGSPIPILLGQQMRISGNVIWTTGLIETVTTSRSGGKGGKKSTSTTYSYRVSAAISVAEGQVGLPLKIIANGKVIFDVDEASVGIDPPDADVGMVATKDNGTHSVFDTLRFYQGTGTQQVDPTIEADKGVGNTPAYRHTAYFVLVDLQLADFGNSMPNIEVVMLNDSISVAGTVKLICARAGIDMVSAITVDDSLGGYVISRPSSAAAAIEPLSLVYLFDLAEQCGQIRAIRRGGMIRGTLENGDTRAGAFEVDGGDRFRHQRLPDINLPREASVTYSEPNLNFQPNTQRAMRSLGDSNNKLGHDLPLVLEDFYGMATADRLLWEAAAGRRTVAYKLSERWLPLQAGDIAGVPVAGEVVPYKVQRMTRGANGVLEFEGRYEDPEVYESASSPAGAIVPTNTLRNPGPTRLVMMDAPIAQQADDDPGFYWAVTARRRGWRGATILRSSDGGTSYSTMSPVAVVATIGDVENALDDGPADFWDRGNVLTVVLAQVDDELESKTEAQVLAGANIAWLGDPDGNDGEVLQFRDATLIGVDGDDRPIYELTHLLRGRAGTDHAIANHGNDEVFVMIEPDTLGRSTFGVADWDRERDYKPVSIYLNEADVTEQQFTNTGEGQRPYSVAQVRGHWQGGDFLITWKRRSRYAQPGIGRGELELAEASERYIVEIISGGDPIRTFDVTEEEVLYTSGDLGGDGFSEGDPIEVRVYQISEARGRGRVREATI